MNELLIIPIEELAQNYLSAEAAYRQAVLDNLSKATTLLGKQQGEDAYYLDFDDFKKEERPCTILGLVGEGETQDDVRDFKSHFVTGLFRDADGLHAHLFPDTGEMPGDDDYFTVPANLCSLDELLAIHSFIVQ